MEREKPIQHLAITKKKVVRFVLGQIDYKLFLPSALSESWWNYYTKNLPSLLHYTIARNFWGRKLLWIGEKYDSRRKYFCGVLAFSVPKDAMLPNLAEKTFMNTQKTAKFAKVLSLKSFPLYACLHIEQFTKRLWMRLCITWTPRQNDLTGTAHSTCQ